MTTFLMSPPSPDWHIAGGANPTSRQRAVTDPRRAFAEWQTLARALDARGAQIAVLPPDPAHPLTGLVYTSNAGQLFAAPRRFRLAQMSAAHRREERAQLERFFQDLGIAVEHAENPWEGQAEICTDGEHYLLSWGVRSAPESVEEVQASLPAGARALGVQLRSPFTHGDTCLCFLRHPDGKRVLLVYPGALLGTSLRELETFLGSAAEVLPISEADALAQACNSLCVNGQVLTQGGVSRTLREALQARGFRVEALDLPELSGKGGGALRSLVNDLGALEIPPHYRWRPA